MVKSFLSYSNLDLAICVLFYEKVNQTIKCVKSFLPSGVPIYILNNASSASSREVLGKYCEKYSQVTIFDSEKNLGVAVGRNYLIENTKEKWLLFVDNDIHVKTKDWLERIKKHVSVHHDIEAFIPRLFNVHDNKYQLNLSMRIEGNRAFHDVKSINNKINTFLGGASFINRKLFDRLGLYDEQMFIGFEDYEYTIRSLVEENPVKGFLIHDIELIHEHRYAKKKVDKDANMLRYDHNTHDRSYKRIYEKHKVIMKSDWPNWISVQKDLSLKKQSPIKVIWEKYTPEPVKKMIRKFKRKKRKST